MREAQTRRGLYVLIVAIVLALAAAVSAALLPGGADFFATVTEPLTRPLRGVTMNLVTSLEQVYNYIYRYDTLEAENAALRARVAALEEEYREYTEINEENKRLRALLGFRERHAGENYGLEPATVISWTASNFGSTFTLNRGLNAGVSRDDAVITADGYLVGVVTEVGAGTSTVTTLLDTSMSVGVLLEATGETGLAEGNYALFQEERLKLNYLDGSAKLVIGDTVVTSGRGGTLPSGLVVGHIETLREDLAGSGSYAVVRPAADIANASAVYIITNYMVS